MSAAAAATSAGLRDASATLGRATAFLAAGLRRGWTATPAAIDGPGRAKLVGNGLRELDRFLNLLVDAVAEAIGPGGFDHPAFARQRNTANKLRCVRAAMALPSPDHERLRAVGRSRDRLFHRGLWHPGDLSRAGVLADLCRFYDRLAAELLAACEAHLRLR